MMWNHLYKQLFEYFVSLTSLWRNLGPLSFTTLLQFVEVYRHSLMHISREISPEVWTLAIPTPFLFLANLL